MSPASRAASRRRAASRSYQLAVDALAAMPDRLMGLGVDDLAEAFSSITWRMSELSRSEYAVDRHRLTELRSQAARVLEEAQAAWRSRLTQLDPLGSLGARPAPSSGFIALVGAVLPPVPQAALLSSVSLLPFDPFDPQHHVVLVPAASGSLEVLRRHVADLRSFDQSSARTIPMLVSVEDRAVCETAAALWDPMGDGEYADPERALAAARALIGPVSPVTDMLRQWQADMRVKYRIRPPQPGIDAARGR